MPQINDDSLRCHRPLHANITSYFIVTAHYILFTWDVFPWTAISAFLRPRLHGIVDTYRDGFL